MPNKYMYASGILHKKKKEKKPRNQFILKWNPQVQPPPPFLGGLGAACLYVTTCYYFV